MATNTNRMDQYKNTVSGNIKKSVRSHEYQQHRRENRDDLLAMRRHIEDTDRDRTKTSVALNRRERLANWKKERDAKKRAEADNKKPIFKVSKVPSDIFGLGISRATAAQATKALAPAAADGNLRRSYRFKAKPETK